MEEKDKTEKEMPRELESDDEEDSHQAANGGSATEDDEPPKKKKRTDESERDNPKKRKCDFDCAGTSSKRTCDCSDGSDTTSSPSTSSTSTSSEEDAVAPYRQLGAESSSGEENANEIIHVPRPVMELRIEEEEEEPVPDAAIEEDEDDEEDILDLDEVDIGDFRGDGNELDNEIQDLLDQDFFRGNFPGNDGDFNPGGLASGG